VSGGCKCCLISAKRNLKIEANVVVSECTCFNMQNTLLVTALTFTNFTPTSTSDHVLRFRCPLSQGTDPTVFVAINMPTSIVLYSSKRIIHNTDNIKRRTGTPSQLTANTTLHRPHCRIPVQRCLQTTLRQLP